MGHLRVTVEDLETGETESGESETTSAPRLRRATRPLNRRNFALASR